jgi:hypothetical protein
LNKGLLGFIAIIIRKEKLDREAIDRRQFLVDSSICEVCDPPAASYVLGLRIIEVSLGSTPILFMSFLGQKAM